MDNTFGRRGQERLTTFPPIWAGKKRPALVVSTEGKARGGVVETTNSGYPLRDREERRTLPTENVCFSPKILSLGDFFFFSLGRVGFSLRTCILAGDEGNGVRRVGGGED